MGKRYSVNQSTRQSVRTGNQIAKVAGGGLLLSFLAFGIFQSDQQESIQTESSQTATFTQPQQMVQDFSSQHMEAEASEVEEVLVVESAASEASASATEMVVASPRLEEAVSTASAVKWNAIESSLNASGTAGLVKWQTAMEKNSAYFQVERSLDGESFEKLGRLDAAGFAEEATSYQFEDESLGMTQMPRGYYRIRQIGKDGRSHLSEAIEYDLNLDMGLYGAIQHLQQEEMLKIDYAADGVGPMTMRILSLSGETMVEEELTGDFFSQSIGVEIAGWEKGKYYLQLSNDLTETLEQFDVN